VARRRLSSAWTGRCFPGPNRCASIIHWCSINGCSADFREVGGWDGGMRNRDLENCHVVFQKDD